VNLPRIFTLVATAAFALVLAAGCNPGGSTPAAAPATTATADAGPVTLPSDTPTPDASPTPGASIAPSPPPSPTRAKTTAPATHKASPKPKTTTRKPSPAPAQTIHGVHPGAFCSQHGDYGLTVDGVLMRCTTTAADSRYRWRKA
jgi:hypothetical protein